jgi:hypothetical protein
VGLIRSGGLAGEGPSDGRQRDSGGAAAAARFLAQCRVELCHWLLVGAQVGAREDPGVASGSRHKQSRKLTGGANGGRWRTAVLLRNARGKGRGVL